MPLSHRYNIPSGEIAIWSTIESYEGLAQTAHPSDLESAQRFSNITRRTEHLSARAALRAIAPDAEITYNGNGAPVLLNSPMYLSLSHCKGMAGAFVSGQPCAIDIENTGRDFSRASSKFVSPAERALPEAGHHLFLPALWCAKEAMYKYSGTPGLDFIRDLEVLSTDLANTGNGLTGILTARIGELKGVQVKCRTSGEFIICYI